MSVKSGILVGKTAEFNDGDKKIVSRGNGEIGVYYIKGGWYAYQNMCPHQGGPACEGLTMAKVEAVIAPDKTAHGHRFNHDEMHIVCPWHGWEFKLADGMSCADRNFRLRKYDVEVRGGEVYVLA
jgi:nitrite reductase/ring-hydroxylating ferredoxin subunit